MLNRAPHHPHGTKMNGRPPHPGCPSGGPVRFFLAVAALCFFTRTPTDQPDGARGVRIPTRFPAPLPFPTDRHQPA